MNTGGRRPDFLIIGAMKAGTTSLYHYLRSHPEVFMPRLKEIDFFTDELNWNKGWAWYGKHFENVPTSAVAVGEASTSYTKYPRYSEVAPRIAEHLPNARLVYVVRDPVERIRSHYQHNVNLGEERTSLEDAVHSNPVYVDYSRYSLQIDQYLEHFAREQILVITSEGLRSDRRRTVEKVLEFLGVDPHKEVPGLDQEFYKTEQRPQYGPLVGGVRRLLKRLFPTQVALWRGQFLPESVKRALGKRRTAHDDTSPMIDDQTRRFIASELHDDVARLRTFLGPHFDGWGIG